MDKQIFWLKLKKYNYLIIYIFKYLMLFRIYLLFPGNKYKIQKLLKFTINYNSI